jgi:formylglycine-generating enzyme required for sulfatase activity
MADPFTLAALGPILEAVATTVEIIELFVEEPGLTREEFYQEILNERRHNQAFIARANTLMLDQIRQAEQHVIQAFTEHHIKDAIHNVVVCALTVHNIVSDTPQVDHFVETSLAMGLTQLETSLNSAKFIVEPVYWEGWQQCFIAARGAIIAAYEFLGRDTSRYRAELEQAIREIKIRTLNTIAASFDFQSETFPWDDVSKLLSPSGSVEALLALGGSSDLVYPVLRKEIKNSIGMEFVLIPAGEFLMGTPKERLDAIAAGNIVYYRNWIENETPQHRVSISQPFYLGKYPVTQAQWQAVMGTTIQEQHDKFKAHWSSLAGVGDNHPMYYVSWEEAQQFMHKLNEKEGKEVCRLPTEAEWEYAARAGTTTLYSFGDNESQLGNYAWYDKNAGYTTHLVGGKEPNAWGLHDMHGNVHEWVQDWYAEDYYQDSPNRDPRGPDAVAGWFPHRVLRGGCCGAALLARSAYRRGATPGSRSKSIGFRCLSLGVSQ